MSFKRVDFPKDKVVVQKPGLGQRAPWRVDLYFSLCFVADVNAVRVTGRAKSGQLGSVQLISATTGTSLGVTYIVQFTHSLENRGAGDKGGDQEVTLSFSYNKVLSYDDRGRPKTENGQASVTLVYVTAPGGTVVQAR